MNQFSLDLEARLQLEMESSGPNDLFYIRALFSSLELELPKDDIKLEALMLDRKLQSRALGFWEALNNKLDDDPRLIMSPVANEEGSLSDYNEGVLAGLEYKRNQKLN